MKAWLAPAARAVIAIPSISEYEGNTVEFRVNALLAEHNVARVIADTAENPSRELTADFAYCRLQGPIGGNGYQAADIADWAATVKAWAETGRDVFAYFVHEDKLHAPANAIALRQAAGISLPDD